MKKTVVAWLTEAEIEWVRWYRSLTHWEVAAINMWLLTGDTSQLIAAFTLDLLAAA